MTHSDLIDTLGACLIDMAQAVGLKIVAVPIKDNS